MNKQVGYAEALDAQRYGKHEEPDADDDDNAQIGTPSGHYAPPAEGPFLCMRCIHFTQIPAEPTGMCDHPKIIKDAKAGALLLRDGKAVVHHEGCSDYFNPGELKATSIAHQ